jgi:hypothetical protein
MLLGTSIYGMLLKLSVLLGIIQCRTVEDSDRVGRRRLISGFQTRASRLYVISYVAAAPLA